MLFIAILIEFLDQLKHEKIIDAFHRADQPLSVRDLSKVFGDFEPAHLDHHVGRLRQLGALELVSGKPGGFMDVRYRLIFRASLRGEKISSLEEGKREPSLGDVVRLATALSVSVKNLLEGIEWQPDGRGGGRFELPDVGDAPGRVSTMPLDLRKFELAVFLVVTDLHPVHLTLDGLVAPTRAALKAHSLLSP